MELRDSSLIYETFSGNNFFAVIFISTFSDRRSLIIESEKNTVKTQIVAIRLQKFRIWDHRDQRASCSQAGYTSHQGSCH